MPFTFLYFRLAFPSLFDTDAVTVRFPPFRGRVDLQHVIANNLKLIAGLELIIDGPGFWYYDAK